MTLLLIDIFYIIVIALIFTAILTMEIQIKEIKTMMKEHVKFDDKMAKEVKERLARCHDEKYPKNPLVK
jgi:uncharacterized membrane protein|tara:strand:+ start:826 stop:1032 length:207 start_codon:yes stop_codon:yes gene_type:complete